MKITDALEKGAGKAAARELDWTVSLVDGILYWFDEMGKQGLPVQLSQIDEFDWQPYPTKKYIRPERDGEVWEHSHTKMAHTERTTEGNLVFVTMYETVDVEDVILDGWTRIYPKEESNTGKLQDFACNISGLIWGGELGWDRENGLGDLFKAVKSIYSPCGRSNERA